MILKLVNSESKTLVGAAMIVGVLSFVSRIIGLIRDRILAGEFGAGDILDAYYAAFKLPDLLFGLIVIGSLSASFIPLFTKYYAHRISRERAWELTNNTLHFVLGGMGILSILMIIFAEPLASVIAPGFKGFKMQMVVDFMRVMFLAQILLSASLVFGSALQGMKRFFLYSLAPILYNVGIIFGAVYLVDAMGSPLGLAWGVVLGAALHLLIQLYGAQKAGYRYAWRFNTKDEDTKTIIRLAGPRMLGVAVSQINIVIFTVIASTLAVGSVTIFQFAYNIQFFPVGIIGIAYAIAAFPSFSEHLSKNDTKGFIEVFSASVRQILFFIVPLMMLFLVVRAQIVRVIVGAGEFDWPATILTADTLAFFALSFVPQALVFLFARAFFALHDTITPFVAGLVAAVVGLISALWLTEEFGVIGLGLAYTLAATVNLVLLWSPLRQRIGRLDGSRILQSFFKIMIAALPAAVIMQLLKPPAAELIATDTFVGIFLQGFIAGGVGLIVYFLIAWLVRSEELHMALAGLRRKVIKKTQLEETVNTESPTAS